MTLESHHMYSVQPNNLDPSTRNRMPFTTHQHK